MNIVVIFFTLLFACYPSFTFSASESTNNITNNISDLQKDRLTIEIFPLNNSVLFVSFPDGRNMLVDTGGQGDSENLFKFISERNQLKNKTINWVVITNPSIERTSGLRKILNEFRVKEIITGVPSPSPSPSNSQLQGNTDLQSILSSPLVRDITQTNFMKYEERDIADTRVVFFGPEYSKDNPCLSVSLTYKSVRFLFPSCIDNNAQENIIATHPDTIKSNVLFAGKFLTEKFISSTGCKVFAQPNVENVFVTDGQILYISKKSGVSYISEPLTTIPQPGVGASQSELERLNKELDRAKKEAVEILNEAVQEKKQAEVIKPAPVPVEPKKNPKVEKKKKEKIVKKKVEEQKPEEKVIPKNYTVGANDTLPSIAAKIYGDSNKWTKIYEANKDIIVQGQIQQGQVLTIPEK